MKNIWGTKASLDMPIKSHERLLFGFVVSKKAQSALMILISLLLLAEVGSFKNYLSGTGSMLLGLAAIGSYFRKHWVQYCFFAWSVVIYLRSLILLLSSVKRGASSILQLDTVIDLFILQCFIGLPFLCAGYLAQLFFDKSAKLHKNSKSANLALAYGATICALMSPSLVQLIANSSILPTPQTLIERAIALGVTEKWLLAVATLPHLIFNIVCSAVMVFMLAMLFSVWSRRHTITAPLIMIMLFFSVGMINFLVMKMNERWPTIQFFEEYELVLLPAMGTVLGILIGGLSAEFIKKRIGLGCRQSKYQ